MDRPRDWKGRRTYNAWFEGGPRDATQAEVRGLDSGQPPDLLLTPGRPGWIYVLAGGARPDGTLPYLWMPKSRVAGIHQEASDIIRRAYSRG